MTAQDTTAAPPSSTPHPPSMASPRPPSPALSSTSSSSSVAPVQPDHFYPSPHARLDDRSDSDDDILYPDEDPGALRGIPVFKPTWEEFKDFEAYVTSVEPWGRLSGIVKIVPPKEWKESLPSVVPQLSRVKLRNPIAQEMVGRSGLFRQSNIEKRKVYSIREWADLCQRDAYQAPSPVARPRAKESKLVNRRRKSAKNAETEERTAEEAVDTAPHSPLSVPASLDSNATPAEPPVPAAPLEVTSLDAVSLDAAPLEPVPLEAALLELAEEPTLDDKFLTQFIPESAWLPPDTKPEDYTPEACRELERNFWRTIGNGGPPAFYGADMKGSLFTEATSEWNVASLPSLLSRLLSRVNRKIPGVNTPYLYFGMWRAAFAWHVEDMDLYSINYIHFGAPKVWWAIPSERASAFEGVMKGYFPGDAKLCSQFLRHKSYLVSPTILADSSCRPNTVVQHQGEFVITFPRGYHAGINLGLNCAESINFALNGWEDICRRAEWCECESDSVKLDIDSLISAAAEAEARQARQAETPNRSRKRKSPDEHGRAPKRAKTGEPAGPVPKIRVKPPAPPPPQKSCCLCPCPTQEGLLPVHDVPHFLRKGQQDVQCWAHQGCAMVIPETWVDWVDGVDWVFGVDAVEKARWDLKCAACTKPSSKAYGAKIQCTRGKCPRAYHVSCAKARDEVLYRELEEIEKDVLLTSWTASSQSGPAADAEPPVTDSGEQPAVEAVPQVLKTIKKLAIEVLCSAHNPEMRQIAKQRKDELRRRNVMGLKEGDRIRVRISSGVFEVSLLRVDALEESVEVEWSSGARRAVKWGSIIWASKNDLPKDNREAAPSLLDGPNAATFGAPLISSQSHHHGIRVNSGNGTAEIRNSWTGRTFSTTPGNPDGQMQTLSPESAPSTETSQSFFSTVLNRDEQGHHPRALSPVRGEQLTYDQSYGHRYHTYGAPREERARSPLEGTYSEFWDNFKGPKGPAYDHSRDSGHAAWYGHVRRPYDNSYPAGWSTSSPYDSEGHVGYPHEHPHEGGPRRYAQGPAGVQYSVAASSTSYYHSRGSVGAYSQGRHGQISTVQSLGLRSGEELNSTGEMTTPLTAPVLLSSSIERQDVVMQSQFPQPDGNIHPHRPESRDPAVVYSTR